MTEESKESERQMAAMVVEGDDDEFEVSDECTLTPLLFSKCVTLCWQLNKY